LTKVEEVIRGAFAGIECAAFAVADQQWGQALHLAIAGEVKPELSAINQSLSSKISAAAKIKRAIYLDQLPKTALGKVNRQELASLALKEGE
jgi:O-succinylbenzoic acid--CoA ligase